MPVADKVLLFWPGALPEATHENLPLTGDDTLSAASKPFQTRTALNEERVAEAFAALQIAELREASRRTLDHLEEAYLAEVASYKAALASASASA